MKLIIGSFAVLLLLNACGGSENTNKQTLPVTNVSVVSELPSVECQGKSAGIDFQCSDGCNVCSCDADGHLISTLQACISVQ